MPPYSTGAWTVNLPKKKPIVPRHRRLYQAVIDHYYNTHTTEAPPIIAKWTREQVRDLFAEIKGFTEMPEYRRSGRDIEAVTNELVIFMNARLLLRVWSGETEAECERRLTKALGGVGWTDEGGAKEAKEAKEAKVDKEGGLVHG